MLNGTEAKKHAIEITGDHTIKDVAIAFPVGTTSAQAGAEAVGGAAGAAVGTLSLASGAVSGTMSAVGSGAAGGVGAASLIAQLKLEHTEPYASVVLALTPTKLYLLGRHKIGPLASFANMFIVAEIAREHLHANLTQASMLKHLTLVNDEDGKQYTYEVKPLGSGVDSIMTELNSDS
ncbi:MAG: hypothetical protein GX862_08130 [Leucobacter sp.]|nr:hypothetical protein [Leucobacter sp.]